MRPLPTLRRKILRSFLVLVALYGVLGLLLLASFNIASRTTPQLLKRNYDSISAADRMAEAWTALQFRSHFTARSPREWVQAFEEALAFERGNVTEPGERELAESVRASWRELQPALGRLKPAQFDPVRRRIEELRAVNEKGMFRLASENERLARKVLLGTLAFFALSLLLSVFFADQLAQRLSRPLKGIVEALHLRPGFDRRLKLPEPRSLEMLILTTELSRLWGRLGEADKHNVAELVKQKNRVETLLESVEDGLLVLGTDGRVLQCNECLGALVGLPREQIQGRVWTDLPTMSGNYLKLRTALRADMPDSQQVELDWKGGKATFAARSRAIAGPQSVDSGTLYLLHDVTEKKLRDKFRTDFINLLSHELKTPLQSLGTASELLSARKKDFPGDAAALLDTIAEDVQRIRAVAQEFVQVTQSQSKILKLKLERVALNPLLPEWIKPFSVVAKDRGVRVELKQEGSETIWANLDVVKFPWVVSNILSNAVRFSPKDTQVTVVLTDRSGFVEIQIKDQGPGIPESDQDRMFEPYYQSAQNTAAPGSGARGLFGVGLTIAKEVLEAHEGRIEYHRLNPRGSEFRILLPFPPLEHGGGAAPEPHPETKSWTH